MAEKRESLKEKPKAERVSATIKKMRKMLGGIDKDHREIVESLIENAAFMCETLRDLQKEIDENGVVEEYRNGANQYGYKTSSAVVAYNQMIKNYNQTCRQIIDIVGKNGVRGDADDGFDDFVSRK